MEILPSCLTVKESEIQAWVHSLFESFLVTAWGTYVNPRCHTCADAHALLSFQLIGVPFPPELLIPLR